LKNINIRLVKLLCPRNKISIISDFKFFLSLFSYFRKEKPNLVVSYTIKPLIYSGLLSRIFKFRYVPIVTGLGYAFQSPNFIRKILRKLVISLYKSSFKNVEKAIFQNSDNIKLFDSEGIIPFDRSFLIPGDGVNLPQVLEKEINNPLRFVCVCRLLGEKGLRELSEAISIVKLDYPDFSVELYGPLESSNDRITEEELSEWTLNNTLVWKGYCSDIPHLMKNTDIFVLPSHHEGMCTSVAEAVSYGVPIIGTNIAGIREMVSGNGFLVDVKSTQQLAWSLTRAINLSEKEWREMSDKSVSFSYANLDRKSLMNKIYDVVMQ
ncbi:glycosyltransferase, partial [Vibrio campbellii]